MKWIYVFVLLSLVSPAQADTTADHVVVRDFGQIPPDLFDDVRNELVIYYGHTSHGSQLVYGLNLLANQDEILCALPTIYEQQGDLGSGGSTVWARQTQNWLDDHPEYNVVIWSWCGGLSVNTAADTRVYLNTMNDLEIEYPNVTFVYMTGHLDGGGEDGTVFRNNNQIRDYCAINGKVLFDFADIETWDPDGGYHPDDDDSCDWCSDYCATNTCSETDYCPHSHGFNCYRKGQATWWLLAKIAGWDPTPSTPKSFGSLKGMYR